MDLGQNVLKVLAHKSGNDSDKGHYDAGHGGGNSGAVISPAPGLGLSAYQDPDIPVRKLPKQQGGS